jgi:ribosomal protein S18 acetylase RimI-like enzyme
VGTDVAGVARGHVADLAVIADARRMGVGTALMEAGEAWARDRGLPALSLDVWSTNRRALAFYRRLGYSAESSCLSKRLS